MQKIEEIDIDSVKTNPDNPRLIKDKDYAKLKRSIKEFPQMLFLRPLIIDKDNVILGGNMRFRALQELGYKKVPVIRADMLTEEERKRFVIVDNLPFGEWDFSLLANQYGVEELEQWGMDMKKIIGEFDDLKEDDFNEEDELGKIKEPVTKLGDVYELGQHRVVCGDSTKQEDYDRLLKGEKARLIFTDPPYNVNYVSASKGAGAGAIKNDNKSDESCKEFYVDVLNRLYENTTDDCCIYWWLAFNSNGLINLLAFKEGGWKMSQMITWLKESMVFSRGQDYHRMGEPCFFGWKEGKPHFSVRKITNYKDIFALGMDDFEQLPDVWYVKRDRTTEYHHPTQKPVRLAGRALKKNSLHGDIVIDAFGGSGSALVACEQANRKARLIELDPKFVDVIVTRYCKLKGIDEVIKNGEKIIWTIPE